MRKKMVRMRNQAWKTNRKFNYQDYLNWPDDERWELIDGTPYAMAPAPSRKHQEAAVELLRQFSNYLLDKSCKVYGAPFDVRLSEQETRDEDVETVIQPDILVVCDESKLDDRGCRGAPDLIIEIVSPSSASLDYIKKLELYERYKVKEYWIVQPVDKIVMVYKIDPSGKYGRPEIYSQEDKIKVGIFDNLTIDLGMVFKE